jgi:hypothetical protein
MEQPPSYQAGKQRPSGASHSFHIIRLSANIDFEQAKKLVVELSCVISKGIVMCLDSVDVERSRDFDLGQATKDSSFQQIENFLEKNIGAVPQLLVSSSL